MSPAKENRRFPALVRMSDLDLDGKRVLIRADLNVPLRNGRISDDTRIRGCLPGLHQAMEKGAAVLLVSHLGRPEPGQESLSLAPVAARLSEMLGQSVPLRRNWLDGVEGAPGSVVLCENVRFEPGESSNEEALSRRMAGLCRVFVNDAFAVCHRKHASVHGIAKYAPVACAGPLLLRELEHLSPLLDEEPARPLIVVIGGAKLGTKLGAMRNFLQQADWLIPGGGIANTLIRATGRGIGASPPVEEESLQQARWLLDQPGAEHILLPEDVVCARECRPDADPRVRSIDEVPADEGIFDLGPRTCERICALLREAGTLIWSGPLGVFECEPFSAGTRMIAQAIDRSDAYSVAGGGETRAAISAAKVGAGFSYLSTGGGAFLRYMEGNSLPAIDMLAEAYAAWASMERARDL